MEPILEALLTFVLLYKYAALFVLTVMGAAGLPIPSNTIIIATVYFASQGYLSYEPIAIVGLIGNLTGDMLAFWLVRRYGKRVLRKFGLGWIPESSVFRKMEGKIDRHPVATVFWSRFPSAITPVVNVLAGLSRMPARTFFLTDVIGQSIQMALMFVYGIAFGQNWTAVVQVLGQANLVIGALIVLAVVLLWHRRRRRRANAARTAAHSEAAAPDRPHSPR
jgi:membrane protein DedA with SNARE-associated domain